MTLKTAFPAPTTKAISSPDSRADLAGLVVRLPSGAPRAGILPRSTAALVTSRASMGVDVAGFESVVVRNGLPSFMANDGVTVVPVGAAPASNQRIDVVYAKQNESAAPFSDANNDAVFGYASSPVAPVASLPLALAAVPAGGLPLAAVLVPSGATTTQSGGVVVTQVFPYTALSGAPVWFRNRTELDAWAPGEGALAWLIDKKWIGQRFGSDWQAVGGVVPYADAPIPGATGLAANVWITLSLSAPTANDIVQSSSRLTGAVKGRYRAVTAATFTSAGDARMRFLVNGVATPWEVGGAIASGVGRVNVSAELPLNVGDYVEVQMLTSQASAQLFSGRVALSYAGPLL